MSSKKISIIIPVYNVEKYLKKCLHTVQAQIYSNIEIILINDGSTDDSGNICDEFQLNDERCKVIHQKNSGVSVARNKGLLQSTGEYILFVDGDDWIDLECCEKLMAAANEDCDLIMFPYIREYVKKSYKRYLFGEESLEFSHSDFSNIYRRMVGPLNVELNNPGDLDILSTVWGKMYKRELLTKEFIDTKLIGEDLLYNIYNIENAKNVQYVATTFYHYNKFNDISLTSTFDMDKYYRNRILLSKISEYIQKKDLPIEYVQALQNRKVLALFSFLFGICKSNLKFSDKVKYADLIIKDDFNTVLYASFKPNLTFIGYKWKPFYYLLIHQRSKILISVLIIMTNIWRIKNE